MKIAVLGARGFVGSSLATYFKHNHTVVPVTRQTIDLLDPIKVRKWLEHEKFDVVVNAATTMGNNNLLADTRNNLGLFMNFYNNSELFGKFVNLSSGAELDRSRDLLEAPEEDIFTVMPSDSYDFGQNMKSRICVRTPNFYTIRIFNCFGLGEIPTRIFPRFLLAGNTPLTITNDRYFDYFGIKDLCLLVDYFANNESEHKDVNAVYLTKYKISEVIERFCTLNNLTPNYVVKSTGGNNYTGSGRKLAELPVQLQGLGHSLSTYHVPVY